MFGIGMLTNLMRREALRAAEPTKTATQYGLVSAYDPDKYAVKVRLMPEDIETTWLPMLVSHMGNGFGMLIGPEINDQVLVGFQDGDRDAPYIISRVHSDDDKPPRVESGEMLFMHKSKGFVKIDKKETITIQHKKKHRTIIKDEDGKASITTFLATNDAGDQGHSMTFEKGPGGSTISLAHASGHGVTMSESAVRLGHSDGSALTLEGNGNASIKAGHIMLDGKVTLGGRTPQRAIIRRGDVDSGGDIQVEGDDSVSFGGGGSAPSAPTPATPSPALTS